MWQIQSQLLVAIQYADLDKCSALLAAGADCDQMFKINSQQKPAISIAVERCAYALVELLIKSGSAINRQDSAGFTPLHIAVEMGYECICGLLISNRADVNAVDNQGATPLHVAAKRNSATLIRALILGGAEVSRKDDMGKTPFAMACGVPVVNIEVIQLLLENGSQVDDIDKTGYTPLSYLLESSQYNYETVKTLIDNGARVDLMTPEGKYPIHFVVQSDNTDKWRCLDLLLKSGVDVNVQTDKKRSSVHLAVLESDIESVKILVRANANVNTVDRLGRSPLYVAMQSDMVDFVNLLLDGGATKCFNEAMTRNAFKFLSPAHVKPLAHRISNPNSLKEMARVSFCRRVAPYTAEWLTQNRSEYPKTLLPFLMFES